LALQLGEFRREDADDLAIGQHRHALAGDHHVDLPIALPYLFLPSNISSKRSSSWGAFSICPMVSIPRFSHWR
jgi:hypothetical protein